MAYMDFKLCELPRGRKTQAWLVTSAVADKHFTEVTLGIVQWRSGWRKYVFEPSEDTVFDAACLKEMAEFLERETAAQKANRGGHDG